MDEYDSSLSVSECIEKLNVNIDTSWFPWNIPNSLGIDYKKYKGRICNNTFSIKSNDCGFLNYPRPTYSGLLMEDLNGTKIIGKFSRDLFLRVLNIALTIFFCLMALLVFIITGFNPLLLLFIIIPTLFILSGEKRRKKDIDQIRTLFQDIIKVK